MPKCTINGKEISVADGSTIIQAFKEAKEDIAYYCWHPGLTVAGVCRMCMVEIEGNPRLQIACNTPVTEGMKVSNQSEKVKNAVKWTLDFHLINHPLDCPICDQAGECGLQEYYMKYGKYSPEMGENKVKKSKVVSLGEKVVLDTERCILCSRCVRFTSDVTKTNELGIFHRGDHSEIGTFENRPLNNNYSVNTVDICPVGALTSKDFRFKQRVWYLQEFQSVCNGCSTGCNITMSYNQSGVFRVKPVHNKDINGYWMCDTGRDIYNYINADSRLKKIKINRNGSLTNSTLENTFKELSTHFSGVDKDKVAIVLTPQFFVEEYESAIKFFKDKHGIKNIYFWEHPNCNPQEFDGLLMRGDKNPNTFGLNMVLKSNSINNKWSDLESKLKNKQIEMLFVAGPENQNVYTDLKEKINLFGQASKLIWLSSQYSREANEKSYIQIPMKSFIEKSGTFINYKEIKQKLEAQILLVPEALSLTEFCKYFEKILS